MSDKSDARIRRVLIRFSVGVTALVGLFAAANVAAAAALFLRDWLRPSQAMMAPYTRTVMDSVYPGWSREDLSVLLRETFQPYEYEPFVVFRAAARRGRFVNVDTAGFRLVASQGVWPPDTSATNVFVFGGSTTFGMGLADEETIPSRMQEYIGKRQCRRPVHVYNFGRDAYYSSQERILFERLLTNGHRPDAVVFIDGLNDANREADVPGYAPEFGRLFDFVQRRTSMWQGIQIAGARTPIARLIRGISARVSGAPRSDSAALAQGAPANVQRWLESRAVISAIARDRAIVPLFVVQPVPFYEFDLTAHPFSEGVRNEFAGSEVFYQLLDHEHRQAPTPEVLWLADMQRGMHSGSSYIDPVHYSATFAARIGAIIADSLASKLQACAQASTSGD